MRTGDVMMSRRCVAIVSSPLSLFNNICACASFCFLSVAVVTDHWLYTTERYPLPEGGATERLIRSGLWRKCNTNDNKTNVIPCVYIDYFKQIDRDGLGPTDSILLSLRRAVVFPLVSVLMLLVGLVTCVLGHVNTRRLRPRHQLFILVSGVIYISAGLVLLVGIIIYVGAVTEEAGSKKRGTSSDEARFVYDYGASLQLVLCSFVGSELTGTLSIHLYISKRRRDCVTQLKRAAVIATGVSLIGDRSRGMRAASSSHEDIVSDTAGVGGLHWPATGGDLSSYTFLSTSCSHDMIDEVQYVPLGVAPVPIPEAEQLACSLPFSMSVSNLMNGGHVTIEDMAARRITPV